MSTLDVIRKPVEGQLSRYEEFIRKNLLSGTPSVSVVLDYIFNNRGKGIRPLLVLLSAGLHAKDNESENRTLVGAMLIEMIHTASLVHDDIVDEAYIRRGKPSVNALWRSQTAVLIGDYIFAKSFALGMESGNFDVVTYITRTIGVICESELVQNEQSSRLQMTNEIYLDIIHGKTASLIGTCSGVGALSVGATSEQVDAMKQFGDNLGMAFQIKDDILDYTLSADTGKPVCNDLKERKITLPLLSVMEQASATEKRNLIGKLSNVRRSPANVDYLYRAVIDGGGIERASQVMYTYVEQAKSLLNGYAPSPYLESLYALCDYIARRDK